MGLLDFLKKPKISEGITVGTFECKRDGLTIRGTEYRPQGENLPIAIVCHGFMAFQDTVRHYAIQLAELGHASYCFDFCGGSVAKGKSDGKTTEMSVLTEVKDLEAVIEHLRILPYVNPFEEIKSYNGKVLIVHGTADKIVNLDYSRRAVEAYRSATPEGMDEEKRVRFHIIEGGAHMFSKQHDVIAMAYLKEFAK